MSTETCRHCYGTGRCPSCHGRRYVDDGPHGVTRCLDCMGDGYCQSCGGDGNHHVRDEIVLQT